jgi:hypothetical protein
VAVSTSYVRHPGVDAYLDALPDWQRDLCQQLRDLAHEAGPAVQETVRRRVQPYFVLDGNNRAGGWRKIKQDAGAG